MNFCIINLKFIPHIFIKLSLWFDENISYLNAKAVHTYKFVFFFLCIKECCNTSLSFLIAKCHQLTKYYRGDITDFTLMLLVFQYFLIIFIFNSQTNALTSKIPNTKLAFSANEQIVKIVLIHLISRLGVS